MNHHSTTRRRPGWVWLGCLAALLASLILPARTLADFTLTVVDGNGVPVTGFRWMLEEDNTSPGEPGNPRTDTVSLIIHKSHAPVVATGTSADPVRIKVGPTTFVDPATTGRRYLLSVLADGYSAGGLTLKANATQAKVILNKHELPTAQLSVFAFHDNSPINNAPDPDEAGIPGCKVILHDFLGGPMLTDTFGNPLGTTYETLPNGDPVMVDGAPVVKVRGSGAIYTDANGKALIKNLAMGKYGVQVIPPTGSDWRGGHGNTPNINGAWHQTATIEGTPTVDAWVKANEPMVFTEGFGVGTYHVFFGFIDPKKLDWGVTPPASGVTVRGRLKFNHLGRPPQQSSNLGSPVTEGWVALNDFDTAGAPGAGLIAVPCDAQTGEFEIRNVPGGHRYELVAWDVPLDIIWSTFLIDVPAQNPADPATNTYDTKDLQCQRWFGTYEGSVFYDTNANGFRDPGEVGIPQQTLNLRWRDGTIYQSTFTDKTGDFAFTEVFPFFKWLIAEVDFGRFKPTGMTAVVDEGGPLTGGPDWPYDGVRNPQEQFYTDPFTGMIANAGVDPDYYYDPQTPNAPGIKRINPNTLDNLSRTELSTDPAAPLLLEAIHTFLAQNNRIDWGKINYSPGENGGIAGIVGYGATRAEEDPRQGTIDPWESGVPRVQMVLYQDANNDKVIDDLDGDNKVTLADVDNHPFGFRDGQPPGPEDIDRNGDGKFSPGDAIQIVWTDSWDDAPPTGSVQKNPPVVLGQPIIGNDNYSTWNQVREGVFDGGYLFGSYFPGGMANAAPGATPVNYLPAGMYIVETCPPPGYLIQTEESFNVVFGDAYKPSKLMLAPELVGTPANHSGDAFLKNILPSVRQTTPDLFTVPEFLSLFPDQKIPCSFAGQQRPIADMKWVRVADGRNAAADFHVYTEVPKATRVVGFVLNDFSAEYDPAAPLFGEKAPPGWIPVSFRDWAGHEVARTYSDEYGTYEALLPSSVSAAIPMPSGFAPNMLTLILNDPTMPDPSDPARRIPDPFYNPSFATTPWTLHYYPATFLYADTPILPSAAFVGGPNKQLDVEPSSETPVIGKVTVGGDPENPTVPGPYVPFAPDASTLVVNIDAMGITAVPNPEYKLASTLPLTVDRNYGFGSLKGLVTVDGTPIAAADILSWTDSRIQVQISHVLHQGGSGQLLVTRGDNGKSSPIGVTITRGAASDHFGAANSKVHVVVPADPDVEPLATRIQDAIDAANAGDLIIVPASVGKYNENAIVWKPVRLQGAGARTLINANASPSERLTDWHARVALRLGGDPFLQDEAPGFLVLGDGSFATHESRIDGFLITGSISGGGIAVYNFGTNLRITNNRIIGNVGSTTGGIRIGEQGIPTDLYDNANVTIAYNQVFKNAGELGAGGIGIYGGATGYKVLNNYVEGNVTRGNGAGIGHEGRNPGGLIANNVVAFNENFIDATPPGTTLVEADGGGIYIGGYAGAAGAPSDGAGSVTIINNLIQGNLAGVAHGGGIRAFGINGADVAASNNPSDWYRLDILNNVIVNNVAGTSGGGISIQDAVNVHIIHNTIAWNDCTATALDSFGTDPLNPANVSTPRIGGLATHAHSAGLQAALPPGSANYSDPELRNDLFYSNRSYTYTLGTLPPNNPLTLVPGATDYGVEEGGGRVLHPVNCLTSTTDPLFVREYANTYFTAEVFDEAGNRINVRMTPVGIFQADGSPQGDYHLGSGSPAIDQGGPVAGTELAADFDGNPRPGGTAPDVGADESANGSPSILPPSAPPITVVQVGPPATGGLPAVTPLTGAGVAPGDPVAPFNLNPLPGDPLNPLLDPEPGIDSDGDGIPDNDVDYYSLTAGDGWATMADGTDLYTFGFSDQTPTVKAETARAKVAMAQDPLALAIGNLANQLNTPSFANGVLVQIGLRALVLLPSTPDWVASGLQVQIGLLPGAVGAGANSQRIAVQTALRAIIADIRKAVAEPILRDITSKVLSEGILSANLSAPTMVFHEGRHAYLDLSNVGMLMRPDLFDPHTVHFHGFPQAAPIFDGEPMASTSIGMGGTLRYYYRIVEPGTYLYHCHVEATEHMQMGMIGNLYVLPKQNNLPNGTRLGSWIHRTGFKYAYNDGDGSTYYDVEAAVQVTGFDRNFHEKHIAVQPLPFAALADDYPLFNGRGYPDTVIPGPLPASPANDYARVSQQVSSLVTASKGQRVLLRLSNVSETDVHSLTALGLPMQVVAKDARLLRGPTGRKLYYNTSSVRLGGGETTDVLIDTANVSPGTYLLYGTRLNHLSNDTQDYGGLMTEIVITP